MVRKNPPLQTSCLLRVINVLPIPSSIVTCCISSIILLLSKRHEQSGNFGYLSLAEAASELPGSFRRFFWGVCLILWGHENSDCLSSHCFMRKMLILAPVLLCHAFCVYYFRPFLTQPKFSVAADFSNWWLILLRLHAHSEAVVLVSAKLHVNERDVPRLIVTLLLMHIQMYSNLY